MPIRHRLELYKLELSAFWREYSVIAKMNLFIYVVFCLTMYFAIYVATVFNVDTYIILNIYLVLLVLNFWGRKHEIKSNMLKSDKTLSLYTTPIDPINIIKQKTLKFKLAFILDSTIMIAPFLLSLLFAGINPLDILSYTVLGIAIGTVVATIKELSLISNKRIQNSNTSMIKGLLIGAILGLLVVQIEFIIRTRDSSIFNYYRDIFSFDFSAFWLVALIFHIPITIFKDYMYVTNFRKEIKSTQINNQRKSGYISNEFTKQIRISNREGNFNIKLLKTISMYVGFVITFFLATRYFNTSFFLRDDTLFMLCIVLFSRNAKIFFNARPVYNDGINIHSYVFAKYNMRRILFSRSLINIVTAILTSLLLIVPIYVISRLSLSFLFIYLMIGTLFAIAITLMQEFYVSFKSLYFTTIEHENKGSMIKRVIWEAILIMILLYGFVFSKIVSPNSLTVYLTSLCVLLSLTAILFAFKIWRGNNEFYGELKEYY
ncbi:hypothetical protein CHH49_00670 [Terribacillus saccharophilus]|nr:hypothetical protein CHH49_00670 [Terribacillus saccharophilus]